jgi:hypothetical protein
VTVKKHMLYKSLGSIQFHLFWEAVNEKIKIDTNGHVKKVPDCHLKNAGNTAEAGEYYVITR